MGLVSAGHAAELDRYVGYYEPYATSHDALDRDRAFQEETRNAARALVAGGEADAPRTARPARCPAARRPTQVTYQVRT